MTDKTRLIKLLFGTELFGCLSEERLSKIVSDSRVVLSEYSSGEGIYTDSDFKKALGVVIDGSVRVMRLGNGASVILNRLGSGGIFGAASLFCNDESYVTEIISEGASRVLFVPSEVCSELICLENCFALSYIRFLSGKIRFLNRRISELSAAGAERKLAKYLAECNFKPEQNMKQLASILGIGRASLYRMLDSFTESGLIEKQGKNIVIKDIEGIKKLI